MNEYPTEIELAKIRNWNGSFKDLWEYITRLWNYGEDAYRFYKYGGKYHAELHTLGWSGNEDLIEALEHSQCRFFLMWHSKWLKGGHYYFEISPNLWKSTMIIKRKKR